MVNAYLKVVKLDIFDGCYGLFIGMGNIAICDGWMLENKDLELFDISEEEVKDQLLADGLVLFKDPKPLEQIAKKIMEKYPNGFCLGCLRREHKSH